MQQLHFEYLTHGRGCHDLTPKLQHLVGQSGYAEGLCHLFLQHTSASLIISENADPDVQRDMEHFFNRLIPDGDPLYRHVAEGSDDMSAHLRSLLTQTNLTLPIRSGRLALGEWQGVYLWEHRYQAHRRHLIVTLQGA